MSQTPSARSRRPVPLVLVASVGFVLVVIGVGWALEDPPNYDRIEEGLYLGGRVGSPPWRTRAVLNLCEQPDDYVCEVHVQSPIRDAGPAPSVEWLRAQVEWIAAQRREGRRVYVHCTQGVSRSGLVVVAYLMADRHCTVDEALTYVRSKRPVVHPNPAFRTLLEAWEAEVRGRPAMVTMAALE